MNQYEDILKVHGINLIYEDNHLIVVRKPPGILSQSDSTTDLDMLSILKSHIKEKYEKPGSVFLGLVHRLDRPVGGVMIFARTSKAASRLSAQIRERKLEKTYLAIVKGVLEKDNGLLEGWILKDNKKNISRIVDEDTVGAKKASLLYKKIAMSNMRDNKGVASLLEICLITGRPHQIRVQFAHEGHYVLGDRKYGQIKLKYPSLWAYSLVFEHPVAKKQMKFVAPPPLREYPWSLFNKLNFLKNPTNLTTCSIG